MTGSSSADPAAGDRAAIEEKLRAFHRLLSTRYPVAQTPRDLIWTLNKTRLYRYVPVVPAAERKPIPLLLLFALINRPSILDLRPGNSFVEYMLRQGYDVYLLDWGIPGYEDRHLGFDGYVLDYLPRAIRKLKAVSGTEEFSLLGWCIGAIIGTAYAALFPGDGLRNLILLTAPLDFSDPECGAFSKWVRSPTFDVDRIVAAFGNMPGELLDYGGKALTPVESYVTTYLRLWAALDDPRAVASWHSMHTWINDLTPMAGAAFRQLIVELYRGNKLMEGTWQLRGRPVRLEDIRAGVLNVVAERDHIVPPGQTVGVMPRIGSGDKECWTIAGGHIGMMAGSQAITRTWPSIESWLRPRSALQTAPGREPTVPAPAYT